MSRGIMRDAPPSELAREMFALRGPPLPGLDLPESRRPERPMIQHPGSFDLALERGTTDGGPPYRHIFLGYVCQDAIAIFGDEVLVRHEIVLRYCAQHLGRWPSHLHQDQRQEVTGWLNASNMLHHAIRVGQVERVISDDGEPRWRLLSREPVWVIEGRPERAVQARGLPPDEQHRRYALERRRAVRALQAALNSADRTVAADIKDVLSADPHAVITPALVARGGLPDAFEDEPIAAARPTLLRWHREHQLDIERLARWVEHWRDLAFLAREALTARIPAAPASPPIPPEDADALGWL